jgi:cellulose synthase/poly-beta-1,6-N-acetylglucosamine synthase-like glycosyltransferase
LSTDPVHQIRLSDIAIVVAARNESKTLKACVDSLLVAAKGEAEIIIVDDGSVDISREILSAYGNSIKVILETGKGPGHARNVAVAQSNRPYIAFMDGDAKVAPDWLEMLAEGLNGKERRFSSIGGVQIAFSDAGPVEKRIGDFFNSVGFVSDYIHGEDEISTVVHNPTCNVLYLKAAIEKAGGFDESLWPCEDLDLDLTLKKLGYRALYTPKAAVEHRRPETWASLFRMIRRYGFAHAQLVKKRGLCQQIHFVPIALALLLVIVWIWPSSVLNMLLFCYLIYAVCFIFKTNSIAKGVQFSLLLIPTVIVWTFGFFSGLLGTRRVAKQHA